MRRDVELLGHEATVARRRQELQEIELQTRRRQGLRGEEGGEGVLYQTGGWNGKGGMEWGWGWDVLVCFGVVRQDVQ